MVGAGALNLALAVLYAAPEVASAYDDAHLHAYFGALAHGPAHVGDDFEVQSAVLFPREGLAAYLEQHALILWLCLHWVHPFLDFNIYRRVLKVLKCKFFQASNTPMMTMPTTATNMAR